MSWRSRCCRSPRCRRASRNAPSAVGLASARREADEAASEGRPPSRRRRPADGALAGARLKQTTRRCRYRAGRDPSSAARG